MDVLAFYSKSRDIAPGKGAQENTSDTYEDLASIKNWRKILSNFHCYPFKYGDYTYNSIEHVFQAIKIKLAAEEKAKWFTLESGHEIGQGDGALAQKTENS